MNKFTAIILSMLLVLSVIPVSTPALAEEMVSFDDVDTGYWYEVPVVTLAELGIVTGYPDGTFRPHKHVTVAEILTMVVNTLDGPADTDDTSWEAPFVTAARQEGYYNEGLFEDYHDLVTRGDVALILSRALDLDVENRENYISDIDDYWEMGNPYRDIALNVYGAGIMDGYPDGTMRFDQPITRAEAACLIVNIIEPGSFVSGEVVSLDLLFQYGGITLGSSRDTVTASLGTPDRISDSQWDFSWYVYNSDYSRFVMIGIGDGLVRALYSNVGLDGPSDLSIGSPYGGLYSEKITIKSSDFHEEFNVFTISEKNRDIKLTIFIDRLDSNKISGIFYRLDEGEIPTPSSALSDDMAKDMFDMVNGARARKKLPPLQWCEKAAKAAAAHARDMHDRGYFNHICPDGTTPQDRLNDEGVTWHYSGENLAAGQRNAMRAHNALLNSPSHRDIIFSTNFQYLGTGIWIGRENYRYYYAEKYYGLF